MSDLIDRFQDIYDEVYSILRVDKLDVLFGEMPDEDGFWDLDRRLELVQRTLQKTPHEEVIAWLRFTLHWKAHLPTWDGLFHAEYARMLLDYPRDVVHDLLKGLFPDD